MEKTKKRRLQLLAASVFWLGVWQAAAMAIGQEVFLVSPVQALGTLVQLLPQAEFWQRVAFSAGRIIGGFLLAAVCTPITYFGVYHLVVRYRRIKAALKAKRMAQKAEKTKAE